MSNMIQQTAVQILVDNLIKLGYLHSNGFGQSLKVTEVINQAKEMEKTQIKIAFLSGEHQQGFQGEAEHYYNETYGGNK